MTEARPLPSYTRADSAYSLFETDHDPAFPAAVDQCEPIRVRVLKVRHYQKPPFVHFAQRSDYMSWKSE